MRPIEFVHKLQLVDRRIIYAILLVVLAVPFVVPFSLPIYPDRYSRLTYDNISEIAASPETDDEVVLLLTNWGPGTEGENGPQFTTLVRHLLRTKTKFVFCSTGNDPMFVAIAQTYLKRAMRAEQRRAFKSGEPVPQWRYGIDYLNLGLAPTTAFEPLAKTLVMEPRKLYQVDFVHKKPLTEENFPILENLQDVDDISLVLVVTAGDEAKTICGIVQRQVPDLKVATATIGIVANDLYPYVKSGQLCGMLNSARSAAEYRMLMDGGELDPDQPLTGPVENSMSLGKLLLLALVVVGNVAFLMTRRAEKRGTIPPPSAHSTPMPSLPRSLGLGLFVSFVVLFVGSLGIELYQDITTGELPRSRIERADDDPTIDYPRFERVGPELLAEEERETLAAENAVGDLDQRADARAQAAYARMVERRFGEFLAALLTIGILAFLLGDNGLYRLTEAIMVGGAMAFFLLEQWDKVLRPKWWEPIITAFSADGSPWNVLWLLMIVPGSLWYFVYSRKYRWLNQLVVAIFVGLVIGPEFGNRLGQLVPQIVDTIGPVWPITDDPATNWHRIEHLIFVIVLVLSLVYFIFFLRPKTKMGNGVLTAGRLVMMIGFGAMFGNTVNTRLSWLAPRVGFLLDDWLGKVFAQ